ncbi:MAG: META domain-containing protein, partial [Maribacter sp.]
PLFILMMSCTTGEGISENTDFFIGIWELKSATDEKGLDISVPAGIDIVFEDENDGLDFYGASSCNRYFGGISALKRNSLKIAGVGSTNRACTDSFEYYYLETLQKVNRYAVENNILYLFFNDAYFLFERPKSKE